MFRVCPVCHSRNDTSGEVVRVDTASDTLHPVRCGCHTWISYEFKVLIGLLELTNVQGSYLLHLGGSSC